MIKTQVQIPDELYRAAKRVARERELSLAEVKRQGLEDIVGVYPALDEENFELPRVNVGKGPSISLDEIQRAREADMDKPVSSHPFYGIKSIHDLVFKKFTP